MSGMPPGAGGRVVDSTDDILQQLEADLFGPGAVRGPKEAVGKSDRLLTDRSRSDRPIAIQIARRRSRSEIQIGDG